MSTAAGSTLRDHLQAIRADRGRLDPEIVVEAATDPAHPLHGYFEWDNDVAGPKYRLDQAGQLLRVVRLPTDPTRPQDLRAFVAVKGQDSHRADYVPTEEALADEFTRKLVLADMRREWMLLKRRYEHMAEFADLIVADLRGEAS